MGSVMSSLECPNCKEEAMEDFYYKTGELFMFCSFCGFYHNTYIEKYDENDEPVFKEDKCEKPYCLIHIMSDKRISAFDSCKTEEAFEKLKKSYIKNFDANNENLPEMITARRFANGKFQTRTILKNKKIRNPKFKF